MIRIGFFRRVAGAVALSLIVALLSLTGVSADEKSEAARVKEIEQIVHDYLLKNPEVVYQALEALRARQAEAEKQRIYGSIKAHRNRLDNDADSVVVGNPDGDVTIVEFFDYNCPYCKRSYKVVKKLLEQDKGIRLVYKEFPILGPASLTASRAAIASRSQGLYAKFHDAMMEVRGRITNEQVMQVAKEVGLDIERLKKDMQAPDVNRIISANHQLAQALNINGTPAYIIGDTLSPGFIPLEQLTEMVAEARTGCTTC